MMTDSKSINANVHCFTKPTQTRTVIHTPHGDYDIGTVENARDFVALIEDGRRYRKLKEKISQVGAWDVQLLIEDVNLDARLDEFIKDSMRQAEC
jgi:hypothetical protein